jgi:hypothetical protein
MCRPCRRQHFLQQPGAGAAQRALARPHRVDRHPARPAAGVQLDQLAVAKRVTIQRGMAAQPKPSTAISISIR